MQSLVVIQSRQGLFSTVEENISCNYSLKEKCSVIQHFMINQEKMTSPILT